MTDHFMLFSILFLVNLIENRVKKRSFREVALGLRDIL